MKILLVISIGHISGGAEKSVALLKSALQAKGHEVRVTASDYRADPAAQNFSDSTYPAIDSDSRNFIAKLLYHLWYPAAYRHMKKELASFQPDVVHFHTMGQLSPSSVFALGSTPGVLTVHGPEEYTLGLLKWFLPSRVFTGAIEIKNLTNEGKFHYSYYRFLQRPLYKYAFRKHVKFLIAPSKYMAEELANEDYSVAIKQIYNGITLPDSRPLPASKQLLYVGRLEHVKGVDILLKAMTAVIQRVPQARLVVVGDGGSRSDLEVYVKDHGLENAVEFKGWIENSQVTKEYEQSVAVVIPSIWPENLPTVCIEALAVGRPVIGSNTGGIPELVQDGKTGHIVEPGNVSELADKIVATLTVDDIQAMSRAATSSMKRFDIDTFITATESVYKEAINENTRY